MYHSVTFGSMNSFSDWHLVPSSRPVIKMPSIKVTTVSVPGASGLLDLSETLTKYPLYKNRGGQLTFYVLNDHENWKDLYQRIANYLHGKRMHLILEDDPDYYYDGRMQLTDWVSNPDGSWSDITIDYNLDPYKYYKTAKTYTNTLSGGSQTLDFQDDSIGQMPIVPQIKVNAVSGSGLTIVANNAELGISNLTKNITHTGTYKYYDIILSKIVDTNVNSLYISGNGTYTVSFRKGDL